MENFVAFSNFPLKLQLFISLTSIPSSLCSLLTHVEYVGNRKTTFFIKENKNLLKIRCFYNSFDCDNEGSFKIVIYNITLHPSH